MAPWRSIRTPRTSSKGFASGSGRGGVEGGRRLEGNDVLNRDLWEEMSALVDCARARGPWHRVALRARTRGHSRQ